MNRRQAKIYSKLTPEEVQELRPDFNTECYEIMKAFGEGAEVAYGRPENLIGGYGGFSSPSFYYKIIPETHVVNTNKLTNGKE